MRNWLIGFYIVEFEQNGDDRAKYGVKLLNELSAKIEIKGLGETNLKLCRQFYVMYPEIQHYVRKEMRQFLPERIRQSATDEFGNHDLIDKKITAEELEFLYKLFVSTSFTHFVELIKIDDSTKRKFYELLIIKTTPSVAELKRQIDSLTFERFGLSADYETEFHKIQQKIEPLNQGDIVKSHYFFEFLNLNHPQLIEENDFEMALINHLQQFILELGNGFCFEARQKRLLIGSEYYFIDLLFYHRILKCHVLVELKTENVKHEHIGQLKTYLNFFKKNIMLETDNPPVGILLVTNQNKTLVEYAVADSDSDIFVSQYLLQLPEKNKIASFIDKELKSM